MTLDQLRVFVAVAEREHLTRAATALNLTPSAVSAAVHALEERYATHLFHRVGRGIALTSVGRLFLDEARATLAAASTAERALRDLSGLSRGSLSIAASQTVGSYWLPPAIMRFTSSYPGIEVTLIEGNTSTVARAVLKGEADLGFVEGAVDETTLAVTTIAFDRLLVVAAPDHPLAQQRRVSIADLVQAVWVMREAGSGTRSVFEATLREAGLDPRHLRIAMTFPTNEAMCAAVRSGASLATVSELVAAPHLEAARLVALRFDLPQRPFTRLRHRERYRSKAAQTFEAQLLQ